MIHSIIKRDGRVVLYDQNKIAAAILKALEASGEGNAMDAARVANDVQRELEVKFPSEAPNIEAIQDSVEKQLMNHGFNAADVVSVSDSHCISSSSISAIFRSIGVVTLMFRSSPSTIFTFIPRYSTAEASSVTA